MKAHHPVRSLRSKQQGYALLLILFFLALVVLSTVALAPNIISDGQREKEKEMVWRGRQYARGVGLYYAKTHRFPTALEDLYTTKTGIRFMRQPYKDPMNSTDGSWRLIYIGPNGQLIGSLKNHSMGGMAGIGTPAGQVGTAFGNNPGFANTGLGNNSSFGGASSFNSGFGSSNSRLGQSQSTLVASSFGNASPSTLFGNPTSSGSFSTAPTDASSPSDANAPNLDNGDLPDSAMQDGPMVMGGKIIGVGSKINKKSFLWYDKAKNYRLFEFIWDPSKSRTLSAPVSAGLGTPAQNTQQTPGLMYAPMQNPMQLPGLGPMGVQPLPQTDNQ